MSPLLSSSPNGQVTLSAPGRIRGVRVPLLPPMEPFPLAPGVKRRLQVADAVRAVNADPSGWGITATEPQKIAEEAEKALDWARHGWTVWQRREWVGAGVRTLDGARSWLALGATARDAKRMRQVGGWLFVTEADLPTEFGWGGLRHWCTPQFARVGVEQGQSRVAIRDLAQALGPTQNGGRLVLSRNGVQTTLPWTQSENYERIGFVTTVAAGLDWGDVATCVRAGMNGIDAARHVRSGADMEPVRLVAALSG